MLDIGLNPIPICFAEARGIEAVRLIDRHFVFLIVRGVTFQRTESAGLRFAKKHLVAFPPASLLILGKDPVVIADKIELIIMLADHIDSVRGFVGNTLIQPCFRGHAGKHRVELGYLRARPHPPPVEMNPDQGAVAVRAAVGNVKHLAAD